MNGYFQVVSQNGMCYVKLIPPTDGGEPIDREELTEYLSVKNISYDIKELAKMLESLQESYLLFPTKTEFKYKDGESAKVITAPDNMSVTVRLYPPFEGGEIMSKTEFMREFSTRGIVYGFDEPAIDAFLEHRKYCTSAVLVKGTPAIQGTDASIEYFFNTDPRVKPTINSDGTVDFFNLNTINHCMAGDLLARLTPAEFGESGRNVKGEWIKSRDVKRTTFKYGHNIEVRNNGTELYSMVSGHVSYIEGKVFVSNVFEVENVDNSVGNIDYDGSVCVNGNVCENFSIKAKGSIEVKGVVEGAYLEAGENITIARGMHGMHKGVLKAGGNIVTKFLENAKVTAGGYVESESLLHSDVTAGTDIKVVGNKGFIAGGRACATANVEVKNLGSSMGADTVVEVGMDTTMKTKITNEQKEKVAILKQLATIKPVLEGARAKLQQGIKMPADQLQQLQKLAVLNKQLTEKLSVIDTDLDSFNEQLESQGTAGGQVTVTGDVYPGTKICIGDVSMIVKSSMKYCRFVKQDGEVKMVAIY